MAEQKFIRVAPVEGRRIMRHNDPRRVIDAECNVPIHPHYMRALARGDLQRVADTAPETPVAKTKRASAKKED